MTALPPEAVTAAAVAIHDADCPDTKCSGSALGHAHGLAQVALAAAAPHIRAQVYAEIRQLAIDKHAEYRTPSCTNPGCPEVVGEHVHKLPFADLIPGDGDG